MRGVLQTTLAVLVMAVLGALLWAARVALLG